MKNQKALALILSRLQSFTKPNVREEQYATPAELAAGVLWKISLEKNIIGKTILDLGCGTGILGLGALLLGAKKVGFVDADNEALLIAKKNHNIMERNALQHLYRKMCENTKDQSML